MGDPRHQEAEALIANQDSRQRTECVVASMLAAKQADYMEQIVRKAVRDELKDLRCLPPKVLPEETAGAVRLTDLPDSLIHALDEI
jgi:hypothetical protein